MFQFLPAPDPAYFADNPMCRGCGVRRYSDIHHIEHKGSGGRHGLAKLAIERPGNKIKLCRVCHAASHGEHLAEGDFSCDSPNAGSAAKSAAFRTTIYVLRGTRSRTQPGTLRMPSLGSHP